MIEITIPMPAISINHTHITTRYGKRIKKKATHEYEAQFIDHMAEYAEDIAHTIRGFNPRTHSFYVEYVFFFEKSRYFNKNGYVSQTKVPDLDNLIKLTQDLVFSKIANDSFITEIFARKKPTDLEDHIKIKIEIIENDTGP